MRIGKGVDDWHWSVDKCHQTLLFYAAAGGNMVIVKLNRNFALEVKFSDVTTFEGGETR